MNVRASKFCKVLFLTILFVSIPTIADDKIESDKTSQSEKEPLVEKVNAVFWLNKLKKALTTTNFDAGIVTIDIYQIFGPAVVGITVVVKHWEILHAGYFMGEIQTFCIVLRC